MSGRRLIEDGADPFERSLLSSARRDRMRPEQKRALAVALGVGAATVTVSAAAGGAQAGVHGAVSAGGAATKTTTAVALKWTAAILVGGTVVGASAGLVRLGDASNQAPQVSAPAPARASVARASRAPETSPAVVAAEDLPTASVTPSELASVGSERAVQKPSPRASSDRPLAAEVELVQRARSALARGDVATARAAVAEHARAFPRGALTEEATVLQIDILARSGDRAGAEQAARAYLAAHPASPHAPRLRELLEGPP